MFVLIGKGLLAACVCWVLLLGVIHMRDMEQTPDGILWQNPLMAHILAERDDARRKAEMMTVNSFRPGSFEYLKNFFSDSDTARFNAIATHLYFYKRVIEFYPKKSDIHQILGFCYYYHGEEQKAVAHYKKAIALNPDFFWAHYDLGIIYFKQGDYKSAAKLFTDAIATKPEVAAKFMYSSRTYREIVQYVENSQQRIMRGLQEGYKNCYRLLALVKHNLTTHSDKQSLPANVDVQIF